MPSRRFRVEWAEAAVRDLEEIVAFIARDSQVNAERVLERIERRSSTLESTPERGRVVPELAQQSVFPLVSVTVTIVLLNVALM